MLSIQQNKKMEKAKVPCGKSSRKSCLSQRTVKPSPFQGAVLNMLHTTRQRYANAVSFLLLPATYRSLLDFSGCCQAHSNWIKDKKNKKTTTPKNQPSEHGRRVKSEIVPEKL